MSLSYMEKARLTDPPFILEGQSRDLKVTLYYHNDGTWRGNRATAAVFTKKWTFTEFENFVKAFSKNIWDIHVQKP